MITRYVLALVLVASTMVGGCQTPPPPRPHLRVLTYNIHHGQGTDGRFDLPRLAAVIRALQPDLVALQEVDRKTRRAGGVDQAAELGRLTGMHARFGKAMDYSGGGYGEAILSRFKVLEARTIPLPADRGFEPRAALAVRVQPPGLPALWFAGTHLDHTADDRQRLMQVDALVKALVRELPEATILAGDLNADADSRPIGRLRAHFRDAADSRPQPTWPADQPRTRIDWVLLRPLGAWRVVEARVIEETVASDHRPLLVELEWVGARVDVAEILSLVDLAP
ncbi:MAG: endonuclease/exonuclease/phosphatase family protein [Phycisphaerae bacterium]|nr:endonuclease/exonuclease/phosphatase family protein [Phycisphaerae bacterium]